MYLNSIGRNRLCETKTYDIGIEEKFIKPKTNPKCSIGNKNIKEGDHTRPNPFPRTNNITEIYA